MDKTFWGVVSASVEQSRRKANTVAREIRPLKLNPESLKTPKKEKKKQNVR